MANGTEAKNSGPQMDHTTSKLLRPTSLETYRGQNTSCAIRLGIIVPIATPYIPYQWTSVILRARFAIPSPIAHIAITLCFSTPYAIAAAVLFAYAKKRGMLRSIRTSPELRAYCCPIQSPMKECALAINVINSGRGATSVGRRTFLYKLNQASGFT